MLFDKLKTLFSRSDMPEETQSLFGGATSTRDLLNGLDELLTRNELEFEEVNFEISKLEEIEEEHMRKIREGEVLRRAKQNSLLYIKRLRKQMDNLQNRLLIFDKNINLHINLIAKIQDMEAMALKGVEEKEIDSIVVEFQTNFERYMNAVIAGEAAQETSQSFSLENQELASLEEEILSSAPEIKQEEMIEEKVVEKKAPVPVTGKLKEEVERELHHEISSLPRDMPSKEEMELPSSKKNIVEKDKFLEAE